jgi:replicative DNA helicase
MISEELRIIRAFLDSREMFDKFAPYVMGLKNLERPVKLMLGYVKKFYEKYPDADVILEPELRLFLSSHDTFNFVGNHGQLIKDIYTANVANKSLTMDIIEGSVEKHLMAKVLDKAALVLDSNKKQVLSTLQEDIDEYHSIIRTPPKDMREYQLDLAELVKDEISTIGIPFVNSKPNDVIRGMRKGQLGLIYAYVDTGKTSYGVANLCSVAKFLHTTKSERPVVYGCNEEDVSRVTLRAIQCLTNRSDSDIEKDVKGTQAMISATGFDKIKFIDHVNNMRIVEKILTKYSPRVMFIDQGTKVKIQGSNKEGVNALEESFGQLRDLAKIYQCTIIAMAQGGDDCFEKKYPDLRDIYGSKSAIQGELDWAISIGIDPDDSKYAGWRFFNITKNKGDKSNYACRFDAKRCQFKQVK